MGLFYENLGVIICYFYYISFFIYFGKFNVYNDGKDLSFIFIFCFFFMFFIFLYILVLLLLCICKNNFYNVIFKDY